MKTTKLLCVALMTVAIVTLMSARSLPVFAATADADQACAKDLERMSGLSNLACTPAILSVMLNFQPVETAQVAADADQACAKDLESISGVSNLACTSANLSVMLNFQPVEMAKAVR